MKGAEIIFSKENSRNKKREKNVYRLAKLREKKPRDSTRVRYEQ